MSINTNYHLLKFVHQGQENENDHDQIITLYFSVGYAGQHLSHGDNPVLATLSTDDFEKSFGELVNNVTNLLYKNKPVYQRFQEIDKHIGSGGKVENIIGESIKSAMNNFCEVGFYPLECIFFGGMTIEVVHIVNESFFEVFEDEIMKSKLVVVSVGL